MYGGVSLLSQAALRRSKQDDHEFKNSLGYTFQGIMRGRDSKMATIGRKQKE
jgi:hypothetical protein